jgi:Gpi18-like mannosyltransferase
MAAALLISTLAAFFLFWGLQELLIVEDVPELGKQSVWLSACWPAGFIFFAGYPESLLAGLTIWCLWMGRREHWVWAAMLGVAAALTKAIGVVVVVPLLVMGFRQRRPTSLVVLVIPAVVVGYLGYLRWSGQVGLPAVYAQYWRTVATAPWTTLWFSLRELVGAPDAILMLNVMAVIIVGVLAGMSGLKIEYALFSLAAICVLLCKETVPPLQSMMRYQLFIFPAVVGMARVLEKIGMGSRWGMVCGAFLIMNMGLLWLFLGWSLVV